MMKRVHLLILSLLSLPLTAKVMVDDIGEVKVEGVPKRVIALDWALTEALLSIGVKPIAIANPDGYQAHGVLPELPEGVVNVGSRKEPNLAYIKALKPDVILINARLERIRPQLQHIAPTLSLSTYESTTPVLQKALIITTKLGRLFDREAEAQAVIQQFNQNIAKAREQLNRNRDPNVSFSLIYFLDKDHIRVFSTRSLFGQVMHSLGLPLSDDLNTSHWGISLQRTTYLASLQDTHLLYINESPRQQIDGLLQSDLWHLITETSIKKQHQLKKFWYFGGFISAQTLISQLTQHAQSLAL